jgi:hypothetical protein
LRWTEHKNINVSGGTKLAAREKINFDAAMCGTKTDKLRREETSSSSAFVVAVINQYHSLTFKII